MTIEITDNHRRWAVLVKGRAQRMAGRAMGWDLVNQMDLAEVTEKTAQLKPKSARHALALWFDIQKRMDNDRDNATLARMRSMFQLSGALGYDGIESFVRSEYTAKHYAVWDPEQELHVVFDGRVPEPHPVAAEIKRLTPKTVRATNVATGKITTHSVREGATQ